MNGGYQMAASLAQPMTFRLSYWYSFLFSLTFLLYGGVNIVLAVLDRQYSSIETSLIYAAVGIILISFALAYKEHKQWGWYGMIAAHIAVIVLALFDFSRYESIILFALSGVVLYLLFAPATRSYLALVPKN